jgi:hypothetical protein
LIQKIHNYVRKVKEARIEIIFVTLPTNITSNYEHKKSKPDLNSLSSKKYMTSFPKEVQSFVNDLNISQDNLNNLDLTLEHIREYLMNQRMEFEIKPCLFTDPEYSGWQEIELKIRIKSDLELIYRKIRPKIYELVRETTPIKLLDKIIIDFETI